MFKPSLLLCAFLSAGALSGAQAATAWDESTSGDFANVGTSPTGVSLGLGSNLILGTTGRTDGVVDRDYFTFTLAEGWQLDSITLLPGTTFLGPSGLGFIGVQAGSQMTVNPTGGDPSALLGWWHYNENDINTDILPLVGQGGGAIGFVGALPAGSYTFWIQETATGLADYRMDFGVSVVPEPSIALMLMAGLVGVGVLRRRG
ncbi:MAG: PEP-CTERM sorting domain-containing protein [Rubrivivax sp.]|nr:PEP-CTERM sorting domain-containing protein [Rubrivivax sp.]